MQREEAIRRLAENLTVLRECYDVANLSIFGSVARNQAIPGSDIDLLVEFSKTPGLFRYMELKKHLENLLGSPVDLVTPKALKHKLRAGILAEAIHVS